MNELKSEVIAYNKELKETIQLLWSCITAKGQKKKALQNEKLKARLVKYGIDISDVE